MGFDEGRMVLDSPNGTYYSGQTVKGKLIFQQDKVKTFRGLYVKIKGFCHVHWTTRHTRRVHGKQESYTVHHNAHEEYINSKVFLVGGESGEHTIPPGSYEYPFQFRLPPNCPSSFEGDVGHIRYEIKAVVDRAFKTDQEKKVAVRVMAPLDLNLDPYCREPMEFQFEETYCCCCMRSGSTEVVVKLPVSGYCPGQNIPVEIGCTNKGSVEIGNIKLCIRRRVTYIATQQPGQKTIKTTMAEIKKGPVPANTNRNWTVEMEVPALDVYNLSGCQYIILEYTFKAVVEPDGCHSNSKDSRKIVIGTIPLVGFQDNVQNPLRDQMPQTITVVTQQPMSSYPPVFNAYPEGDQNQSFGNPPYPAPQPYPSGNSPYPPANPPYPPSQSPYPAPAPYPAANPPYPSGNSPYPDNPPPYPGITNSPYPGANPPYPTSNSPYPPQIEPYGTKSSGGMPSPGNMGGSMLKTGNIGFTVPNSGKGMKLPLLSPNATVQNPDSPAPSNPYATASAPSLDSPDSTEKKN